MWRDIEQRIKQELIEKKLVDHFYFYTTYLFSKYLIIAIIYFITVILEPKLCGYHKTTTMELLYGILIPLWIVIHVSINGYASRICQKFYSQYKKFYIPTTYIILHICSWLLLILIIISIIYQNCWISYKPMILILIIELQLTDLIIIILFRSAISTNENRIILT